MKYRYYRSLSSSDQRIYDQSDAVTSLPVSAVEGFAVGLERLKHVLAAGDHDKTQKFTMWLVRSLTRVFHVPGVQVHVLKQRPSNAWGELHGLYALAGSPAEPAIITVWMRTAAKKQVVAFKTYLRTVLHEVAHHLDYTYLHLADSFHTEGFYKRESSLLRQLLPERVILRE